MNTAQNQDWPALAPSQAIALDNIWLRPASRWGHTEYSFEYHKAYLARHTGPVSYTHLTLPTSDLV